MDNIQLYHIDNEINKIDEMKEGDVIYKNGMELLVVLLNFVNFMVFYCNIIEMFLYSCHEIKDKSIRKNRKGYI